MSDPLKFPRPDGPGPIGNDLEIASYIHCGLCIAELPKDGESPKSYSRTQAGWTERGLQIWCSRHEVNVMHIDFEGQVHPANTNCRKPADA